MLILVIGVLDCFGGHNKWYQSFSGSAGIVCRPQEHRGLFVGDCVLISKRHWSVRGIVCRSQNIVELFVGIGLGGVDHLETHLGFHFEVNVRSLFSLDLLFRWFSALYLVLYGGDVRG